MAKVGKAFDLHFEVGIAGPGDFYAKTILNPPNGVIFSATGSTPAVALAKVALEMESNSMWGQIVKNPLISSFPFNIAPKPRMSVNSKNTKKRPSDITGIPHPDCTTICQSFDLFGDTKCKSICAQRKI
jgi:hypothetical protein